MEPTSQADSSFHYTSSTHVAEQQVAVLPSESLRRKALEETAAPKATKPPEETNGIPPHYWSKTQDEMEAYLDNWKTEILTALNSQRATIFVTGDVLAKAKRALLPDDFKPIWKAVGLRSISNVDNYIRVAGAAYLREEDILPHLPARVGALIDLANAKVWNAELLRKAIGSGVLAPEASRGSIKSWLKRAAKQSEMEEKFKQTKPEPEPEPAPKPFAAAFVVYLEPQATREDRKRLETLVANFKSGSPERVITSIRKVKDKDVKYGMVDLYVDEDGEPIVKRGNEWQPAPSRFLGSRRIRREEDVAHLEDQTG